MPKDSIIYCDSVVYPVGHNHMVAIFLWCHTQGGNLECWDKVLLYSRSKVM